MRPSRQKPSESTRRPPEPMRPLPSRRPGVGLLAQKMHRRRYRRSLPGTGERGW